MSITVNTNMSSLICQGSLNRATNEMNTALQRMSTGLRINSAKDDATGCAISTKLDTKLSSYTVAQDNVQMGSSMLDTASGSIDTMTSMLQRMRDLSEQAANGTYGTDERKAMQAEVDALTEEIYRIKNTTDFNGKKILGAETQTSYVKPDLSISEIDVANITQTEWDSKYKGAVIGISSAEELAKVATLTNDTGINSSGTTFALSGDINLDDLPTVNGSNWTAIGTYVDGSSDYSKAFKGTFDGNSYTIENLKINKPTEDSQGLFGATSGATINNVNLENENVTGKTFTGGLVGLSSIGSTITNCSRSGSVTGTGTRTGGLVGENYLTTITNCSSSGSVTATDDYTGGLVGLNNNNSIITDSSSSGTVKGNWDTGGLVGCNNNNSIITNSLTTSKVTGTSDTGAFLGYYDSGTLTDNQYDSTINAGMKAVGNITATTAQVQDVPGLTIPTVNPTKTTTSTTSCPVNLQVGINTDKNSVITVDTGFSISGYNIDLSSEESARHSLSRIDKMLETVTNKSLEIGATQNRLESVSAFQAVQMSALTSASSLIKDADIAKESASYIKNQILQQTTSTLLATANQNPSIALSLV